MDRKPHLTHSAPRQPSPRTLAAVAAGAAIILGGFAWTMAATFPQVTDQASRPPGQEAMQTVSGRLATDRQWTMIGDQASLSFGQADYVIHDVSGPAPYLLVDIDQVAPDGRQAAAGRAAIVGLSFAQASDHQLEQVELAQRLGARTDDVRTINGYEFVVSGDTLTVRPPTS